MSEMSEWTPQKLESRDWSFGRIWRIPPKSRKSRIGPRNGRKSDIPKSGVFLEKSDFFEDPGKSQNRHPKKIDQKRGRSKTVLWDFSKKGGSKNINPSAPVLLKKKKREEGLFNTARKSDFLHELGVVFWNPGKWRFSDKKWKPLTIISSKKGQKRA